MKKSVLLTAALSLCMTSTLGFISCGGDPTDEYVPTYEKLEEPVGENIFRGKKYTFNSSQIIEFSDDETRIATEYWQDINGKTPRYKFKYTYDTDQKTLTYALSEYADYKGSTDYQIASNAYAYAKQYYSDEILVLGESPIDAIPEYPDALTEYEWHSYAKQKEEFEKLISEMKKLTNEYLKKYEDLKAKISDTDPEKEIKLNAITKSTNILNNNLESFDYIWNPMFITFDKTNKFKYEISDDESVTLKSQFITPVLYNTFRNNKFSLEQTGDYIFSLEGSSLTLSIRKKTNSGEVSLWAWDTSLSDGILKGKRTITDNETGISTIEPFTAILTFTENGNDSTVTVKPTSPEGIGSDFLNVEFTGKYYSSTTTWTPVTE